MKKYFLISFFLTLSFIFTPPLKIAYASGITNPVIDTDLGGSAKDANEGTIFTHYFIIIWQALIIVGALAMLFNLINGALEWITAGGQQEKVSHGRQKMTEGVVGFVILIGSYALIMYIGQIFHFDVLTFQLPTP